MCSFVYKWLYLCCFLCISPLIASWSTPTTISPASREAIPVVAIDTHGNATALWLNFDRTTNMFLIHSAYKPFGKKWHAPILIYQTNFSIESPKIVVDAEGNTTAVWVINGSSNQSIQTAYKPYKKKWKKPIQLSSKILNATNPDIAVDHKKNVTVVWESNEGTYHVIRSITKPFRKEWGLSQIISPMTINATHPQIKVDAHGNMTSIWISTVDINSRLVNIRAASKPFKQCWKPSQIISGNDFVSSSNISLAVGAHGTIAASWLSYNSRQGVYKIRSAYKPPCKQWKKPETVYRNTSDSNKHEIVVDSKGNATLVGEFIQPSSISIVGSSRPVFGHWQPTPHMLPLNNLYVTNPHAAVDASGNVIAIWVSYDKTSRGLYASYKPFHEDWQRDPTEITLLNEIPLFPQIAMNPKGNAVALWVSNDNGIFYVKSATFTRPQAPHDFSGSIKWRSSSHKYLLKATWKPSSSKNIHSYRIYKQSKLLRVIRPDQDLAFHSLLKKKSEAKKFRLTAVEANGAQSHYKKLK